MFRLDQRTSPPDSSASSARSLAATRPSRRLHAASRLGEELKAASSDVAGTEAVADAHGLDYTPLDNALAAGVT